ncbi:sialic acid-binding Ig-like lectin 12 isoform X2 [Hyla sarda]|uniref:sialic acid-binding Ig-like lectin 12 isoform X2 n=1 Tax=Hyla sarda TaxID=327740 RepID=UPI0024C39570|nr:sialic acid-binding Ig-like lectin 12 isoform X2 [Hyla sarda]
MTRRFFFLRGSLLLLFTLGSFCNDHEGKWTFTFPQSISAVRHSDVEIPCNFTAPADYGEVRIVWYTYHIAQYPIVYSEDQSKILPEYRGRTSLIPNGANSCSLRITGVTKREWYYPGISKEINSYKLNREETEKAVQLKIPGCSDSSCKGWGFTYPRSIQALKGSCVEIPCKLKYPDNAQNLTLFWYKNVFMGYPQIFNSRSSSDVEKKYKGRTFLVGNPMDSCSLRMNDVREPVEIYPGVSKEINAYNLYNGRVCKVSIIDTPPAPLMNGSEQMIEKEPVRITCSVNHTCPSNPPSITWNNPDLPVTMSREDRDEGIQRVNSTITYNPSYNDDKTQLKCTVTFPNKRVLSYYVTLNIKYKPRDVTISVVENIQRMEGDNVTLSCTSRANPVAEHTWYEVGKTKTRTRTGNEITVQNGTSEKFICSAKNDMGSINSSVFSFTSCEDENVTHKNIVIIGGIAGIMALAIIVLVVISCFLKRRQGTTIPTENKTQENIKITEKITMENMLYGNFKGAAEQNSPGARNSPLGHKDDGEERNSSQYKEENESCIVYTTVERTSANQGTIRNTGETEYAQLRM